MPINPYLIAKFNESMSPDFNGDSILYIYESITISCSQNVKFIIGLSNNSIKKYVMF